MTRQILILVILTNLFSCSDRQATDRSQTASVDTLATAHQDTVKEKDKVDTFFFTNSRYKEIGDINQLDMFAFQSPNTLLICGKSVDDLKYKIGDGIKEFLNKNIQGTDTMDFSAIETID